MSQIQIHRPSKSWHWVTLTGPDALDFLHRITTSAVRNLPLHLGTKGCILTAQGKMKAYFTLWKLEPSEFAFEFEGGSLDQWKTSFLQVIDQLTFAEQMRLNDQTPAESSHLTAFWIFADPSAQDLLLQTLSAPSSTPNTTWLLPHLSLRACNHGSIDYGKLWISLWGSPSDLQAWAQENLKLASSLDASTVENWRIQANRPQVDLEIDETTIPLEVGLIDTIAPAKGCYPGQEVIERIIALGAPARRLVQLKIHPQTMSIQPGDLIFSQSESASGIEIGKITSISRGLEPPLALGLVRKTSAQEGLSVEIRSKDPTLGASHRVSATLTQLTPYGR